ncbi:hypothetical protein J4419_04420 [Candidatus Woesearchaeota archaeon]|nr:hypothetical protein [Candidatus Woesearchaeota archaeon]
MAPEDEFFKADSVAVMRDFDRALPAIIEKDKNGARALFAKGFRDGYVWVSRDSQQGSQGTLQDCYNRLANLYSGISQCFSTPDVPVPGRGFWDQLGELFGTFLRLLRFGRALHPHELEQYQHLATTMKIYKDSVGDWKNRYSLCWKLPFTTRQIVSIVRKLPKPENRYAFQLARLFLSLWEHDRKPRRDKLTRSTAMLAELCLEYRGQPTLVNQFCVHFSNTYLEHEHRYGQELPEVLNNFNAIVLRRMEQSFSTLQANRGNTLQSCFAKGFAYSWIFIALDFHYAHARLYENDHPRFIELLRKVVDELRKAGSRANPLHLGRRFREVTEMFQREYKDPAYLRRWMAKFDEIWSVLSQLTRP